MGSFADVLMGSDRAASFRRGTKNPDDEALWTETIIRNLGSRTTMGRFDDTGEDPSVQRLHEEVHSLRGRLGLPEDNNRDAVRRAIPTWAPILTMELEKFVRTGVNNRTLFKCLGIMVHAFYRLQDVVWPEVADLFSILQAISSLTDASPVVQRDFGLAGGTQIFTGGSARQLVSEAIRCAVTALSLMPAPTRDVIEWIVATLVRFPMRVVDKVYPKEMIHLQLYYQQSWRSVLEYARVIGGDFVQQVASLAVEWAQVAAAGTVRVERVTDPSEVQPTVEAMKHFQLIGGGWIRVDKIHLKKKLYGMFELNTFLMVGFLRKNGCLLTVDAAAIMVDSVSAFWQGYAMYRLSTLSTSFDGEHLLETILSDRAVFGNLLEKIPLWHERAVPKLFQHDHLFLQRVMPYCCVDEAFSFIGKCLERLPCSEVSSRASKMEALLVGCLCSFEEAAVADPNVGYILEGCTSCDSTPLSGLLYLATTTIKLCGMDDEGVTTLCKIERELKEYMEHEDLMALVQMARRAGEGDA